MKKTLLVSLIAMAVTACGGGGGGAEVPGIKAPAAVTAVSAN